MADGGQVAESAARRYAVLRAHLDERQRRLLLGVEASQLGRGGIKAVAQATGVHPDTVARGVREVEGVAEPSVRVRAPGGGRKKLAETDPELAVALKALVDPETRGDPMSLLVWTTKSTRNLAAALTRTGHPISDRAVARMLQGMGFSLQGNAKVVEGKQHADRDAQFRYLAGQVGEHVAAGQPVVSVDAKKKENVGELKNGGREYQPAGTPQRVNVHDFPDKELGKAIPYGIYDVSANAGWVSVGTDQTPPPSRWPPYGPGGPPSAKPATRTPSGFSSAPTAAGPTGTASAPGRSSSLPSPPKPACTSRSASYHREPRNGTGSSTDCSPRSP